MLQIVTCLLHVYSYVDYSDVRMKIETRPLSKLKFHPFPGTCSCRRVGQSCPLLVFLKISSNAKGFLSSRPKRL